MNLKGKTRSCRKVYKSGPKKGACKEWGPWRKRRKLKRKFSPGVKKAKRTFTRKKASSGRKCTFYGIVKTARGPRWACARRSGRTHSGPKSPNWVGVPIPAAQYKAMKKARAAAQKAQAKHAGVDPSVAAAYRASTRAYAPSSAAAASANPYAGAQQYASGYQAWAARQAAPKRKRS